MRDTPPDPGTSTLLKLKSFENAAWSELVNQYFSQIYGWCLDAGLEPHAAADVTQNIFLSMLGSLGSFANQDAGTFGGWVRRISQRRIADYYRQNHDKVLGSDILRRIPSPEEMLNIMEEDSLPISLDSISDSRVLKMLLKVQMEFNEQAWQAFWLVTVEGKSVAETALELGTTKNIVYLAKSRIKKRLRQIYDSEPWDGD